MSVYNVQKKIYASSCEELNKQKKMEVSNELLAAYAEGHVTDSERAAVRNYLQEHPDKLETVMMMMDADFELEPTDGPIADKYDSLDMIVVEDNFLSVLDDPSSGLQVSNNCIKSVRRGKRSSFLGRLKELLDEIDK